MRADLILNQSYVNASKTPSEINTKSEKVLLIDEVLLFSFWKKNLPISEMINR
jgi:hypothetical protein